LKKSVRGAIFDENPRLSHSSFDFAQTVFFSFSMVTDLPMGDNRDLHPGNILNCLEPKKTGKTSRSFFRFFLVRLFLLGKFFPSLIASTMKFFDL
jgi:hypothetical protein